MVHIYSARINSNIDAKNIDYFSQFISKEAKARLDRFYFKDDLLRTLYGEILVRHLAYQHFGIKNDEIIIAKTSYGKPYIKDYPLHFNISHAGEWVVCAIDTDRVGIDIETIKTIDYNIAKRFFCEYEYESLMKKNEIQKLSYFYDIWTLKESYIKWLGTGLSTNLNSFYFDVTEEHITVTDHNHPLVPNFKQYCIDENYALSVCSESSHFAEKVIELNVEQLRLN